jgi:regulator of sirC expression with transglutaminase-like and TPR domain
VTGLPRLEHARDALAAELAAVVAREPVDLSAAALVIAKLEYPRLDPARTLAALQNLGARAADRLAALSDASVRARIAELNRLLFVDENFSGNRAAYDDFRNSLLNVVLERRLGIPISLGLVYMEVARRAGLEVYGVAFPGHFLLRVPAGAGDNGPIILDPFNGGRELDEAACRALFMSHVGDDDAFDREMLRPCSGRQFIARMLNNLKRTYVQQRSFQQARLVTELLLAVDPTMLSEVRDRGLIAYHLDDFRAALRDLEDYLRLNAWSKGDKDEQEQIREHVHTLRRRVAGLN